MNRIFTACFVAIALTVSALGYTKDGTVYTTDGSQADVNAAIAHATPGDTVTVPPGNFTWGDGGVKTDIIKNITLEGAGQGVTNITSSATTLSGVSSGGLLFVSGPCVIKSMTLTAASNRVLIQCNATIGDGWRFTDLEIVATSTYRMINIAGTYGLFDNNTIYWLGEQIFIVGKGDAWTTDVQPGSGDAVYFENNTFNMPSGGASLGYTDGNLYAKAVYRFNTLNVMSKFDSHGSYSNASSFQSSRLIEAYHNLWTPVNTGSDAPLVEHRGGLGFIFFNTGLDPLTNTIRGSIKFQEYGATSNPSGSAFSRYQGPDDYPIPQQVGIGKNGAVEPTYSWGNRRGAAYGQTGQLVMPVFDKVIPQAAIDEYRIRIGNPAATYTMKDILVMNRDIFSDVKYGPPHDFYATDGTEGGTLIKTRAQMDAITPAIVGTGCWVTDEGEWNSTNGATPDGQLYAWDGDSWEVTYTPYDYPHPLIAETEGAVVRPTHSPDTDTYTDPFEVTIATTTPAATIYYTLDGSTPDNTDTAYSIPVAITETTTLKSIAYVGAEASAVRTSVYTFDSEGPPPASSRKRARPGGKELRIGGKVLNIGDN